ncbi:MAG TPA: hypothetical protein VMA95_01835 [Streptosporangiaceae bacterium]|nr:hypothetical protein [Streptosporangiaceae bacterium]
MATDPNELVTDELKVLAILADPAYVVPPAPPVPAGEHGTLAWLRAHVARFCDGEVHDRRCLLAENELAGLDPDRLRAAAAELTRAWLVRAAGTVPFDVMIVARRVPVAVLATALGVAPEVTASAVDAVLASASGYPNPDAAGPDADAAVKTLAAALGPGTDEAVANRIGLLEQACDATAALIGNALIGAFAGGEETDADGADDVVESTLSSDPPVRRTRRLAPDGTAITLDISTCTFGAGRRPCPGQAQAKALASGVVEAVLESCELAEQQLTYVPSPNLRMPATLLVEFTG